MRSDIFNQCRDRRIGVIVDIGKLITETSEQKFSLRGAKCQKICSHPGGNSIWSILKVIFAGVKVNRMEGKKKLSVICVEVMV